MLKELERMIKEYMYGKIYVSSKGLAQAIIDRLEIDINKVEDIIFKYSEHDPQYIGWQSSRMARKIAKAKPIKLKESDK